MNEVQHVTISLAGSAIDVFTDGHQRWISLTSMSTSVNKPDNSALRFFNGKSPELSQAKASGALQFRNFRHGKFKTLVKCCPLGGAKFYWKYLQRKGDIQADALMLALAEESIERRVDGALGIHHTEAQYEEQTMALRERLVAQALQAILDIREHRWDAALYQSAVARKNEAYSQMTWSDFEVVNTYMAPIYDLEHEKAIAEYNSEICRSDYVQDEVIKRRETLVANEELTKYRETIEKALSLQAQAARMWAIKLQTERVQRDELVHTMFGDGTVTEDQVDAVYDEIAPLEQQLRQQLNPEQYSEYLDVASDVRQEARIQVEKGRIEYLEQQVRVNHERHVTNLVKFGLR